MNRRRNLTELKISSGGKCSVCGYSKCIDALHFHHINEESKISEVGALVTKVGKQKGIDEAKKCVLVCANCHAEIHSKNH